MVATKKNQKLATYRDKRKVDSTPEPFGGDPRPGSRFVVQLHAARARHYDFRLEHDGVLLSWAVPKGPSPDPANKRLAVHVEDHPVDYIHFEGLIPEGNYGAGAVIVWDRGRWEAVKDIKQGLVDGKLLFDLYGYKLRGRWTLVKTKRSPKDWLLIKERDSYVKTGDAALLPEDSVLSGRSVEGLAAGEDPGQRLSSLCKQAGAARTRLAFDGVKPMLATAGSAFSDPAWVFEIKYDGYRLLAGKENGQVRLLSRNNHDFTRVFPEIAEVLSALPYQHYLLDGEVVVHDEHGLPSFSGLQQRGRLTRATDIGRAAVRWPATLYVFDLLLFDDYDLRRLPLTTRKSLLSELLPSLGPIRVSEHIDGAGIAMFEQLKTLGLEGIVAKRADAPYVGRRSTDWIKVNTRTSDDFAVAGYTPGKQSRTGFGALLLAQRGADGWHFAGRVGGGFSDQDLNEIGARLASSEPSQAPLNAEDETTAYWLTPEIVVEVRFKARSSKGRLRQPIFVGLRHDKNPEDCWLPGEDKPLPDLPAPRSPTQLRQTVKITNPDKVFWPDEGYSKGQLVDYYRGIAPYILPYLRDRPLVLTRFPDGIDGKSFYQKDAPVYVPDWIRLETLWSEGSEREIRYFVIEDEDGLAYIANMGAIPLHVWSSRTGSLQHPDWCILDLDPKGAPFAHVVQVARTLHKLCESIGLPHFVKTSGSTGIHVLIPLGARYTHEQSRNLAELLAHWAVKTLPEVATVQRHIEARDGKVYVDYLQNGHGRLLVAPFSVRPVPGAAVSMPLRWGQVSAKLDMHRYNMLSVPKLMAKMKSDPLLDMFNAAADLTVSMARLQDAL
jgi:bifunctional non-homologous end joining protein LigD